MHCVLVSHTHWDREWYRTFQSFRARLVDTVDRVLELIAEDPGYHFLLDGQTIVLEDYLEVRPERRKDLETAVRSGRLGIGPWYVQPDSLLPHGETHVRNLLEGRRVGERFGPVSRVAYTPDSFGHPAQLPQLLRGLGLDGFVYWRGNGNEIEDLGAHWIWVAPDGTRMLACHMSLGYFAASGLGVDRERAAAGLAELGERLAHFSGGERALLMNGSDHMLPDAGTGAAAARLAERTGWRVERGLLDAYVDAVPREDLPEWSGELAGGRVANLLPGVWSTRTPLKLRNRRCEALLLGWAEPWTALARALGAVDERAALRAAWRWLLPNQAHDSLCGCSQDRVHDQTVYRYDACEELAHETTTRVLERLAGHDTERRTPWTDAPELAVFNPSPHPRTDVVRFRLDPWPGFVPGAGENAGLHPLLVASARPGGYAVDGVPARMEPSAAEGLARARHRHPPLELELVVRDVPALGWRRVRLERTTERVEDEVDAGREISAGDVAVEAEADGTFAVRFGARRYTGLLAVDDAGDRGDSYDFDPVPGDPGEVERVGVEVERRRHPGGIQRLVVRRTLRVPAGLAPDRQQRVDERVELELTCTARVAPGVERVDLDVRLVNTARNHRLRLRLPTGGAVDSVLAATTLDVVRRSTARADDSGWRHPAPDSFCQQGFVAANGLAVVAPGLFEASADPDGTLALTLVRAVGWLSSGSMPSRPERAGPPVPTPGAQCLGPIEASLALLPAGHALRDGRPGEADAAAAWDAELGLRAVTVGAAPRLPDGASLLRLVPRSLVLSALKPAEDGAGLIARVSNPADAPRTARLALGAALAHARPVRIDETPADFALAREADVWVFEVPPHAVRTLRLLPR